MDWQHLATEGARSFAAVPIFIGDASSESSLVVASITIASSTIDAIPSDEMLKTVAELLAPHVQRLTYTTCRMEVERIVQRIITPLAAELSVQQGRFKRVKNSCGEDVLCLDETRGLKAARVSPAGKVCCHRTLKHV